MYRISFLSSGTGLLTATILQAIKKGVLKNITPVSIVSDRKSESLKLAPLYKLTSHVVNFNKSTPRKTSSDEILKILREEKIDFVFMTFDRILEGKILKEYKDRIINIHPSLLPAFPGYNTIEKAKDYGCKYIGATCHFIDKQIDHGPIINQVVLPYNPKDKEEKVRKMLYHLRQRMAIEAIYAFSNKFIKINNRSVSIKNADNYGYPINPSLNIKSINNFLKTYEK